MAYVQSGDTPRLRRNPIDSERVSVTSPLSRTHAPDKNDGTSRLRKIAQVRLELPAGVTVRLESQTSPVVSAGSAGIGRVPFRPKFSPRMRLPHVGYEDGRFWHLYGVESEQILGTGVALTATRETKTVSTSWGKLVKAGTPARKPKTDLTHTVEPVSWKFALSEADKIRAGMAAAIVARSQQPRAVKPSFVASRLV